MKIIIISDLHNRVHWIESFLSSFPYRYDKVIFLGDYFDDYNDTLNDIYITAKWLKQSLKNPDRIHLCGTHDLWYRFPYNPFIDVSGNTTEKEKVINNIITLSDWNRLKLFHYEQNFLMTHAGIHSYIIDEYISKDKNAFSQYTNDSLDTQQIIDKIVKPATDKALQCVSKGHINSWLSVGFSRGGIQPVGGIIWLDWNEEFEPIPRLNQIIGHTELKMPTEKSTKDSKNYNLDTKNQHVGILEDEELIWIENQYL